MTDKEFDKLKAGSWIYRGLCDFESGTVQVETLEVKAKSKNNLAVEGSAMGKEFAESRYDISEKKALKRLAKLLENTLVEQYSDLQERLKQLYDKIAACETSIEAARAGHAAEAGKYDACLTYCRKMLEQMPEHKPEETK